MRNTRLIWRRAAEGEKEDAGTVKRDSITVKLLPELENLSKIFPFRLGLPSIRTIILSTRARNGVDTKMKRVAGGDKILLALSLRSVDRHHRQQGPPWEHLQEHHRLHPAAQHITLESQEEIPHGSTNLLLNQKGMSNLIKDASRPFLQGSSTPAGEVTMAGTKRPPTLQSTSSHPLRDWPSLAPDYIEIVNFDSIQTVWICVMSSE